MAPSRVTAVLSGKLIVVSDPLAAAATQATMIVSSMNRSMKSNDCQALALVSTPAALANAPRSPPMPNQLKNMSLKSRIAQTAAIFSPLLTRSTSISSPPEGTGSRGTLHPADGGISGFSGGGRGRPGGLAGLRRGEGGDHQHRDGHRADPARNWGDRRGYLGDCLELDVAGQAVIGAVHADVDHDGSRLHRGGAD